MTSVEAYTKPSAVSVDAYTKPSSVSVEAYHLTRILPPKEDMLRSLREQEFPSGNVMSRSFPEDYLKSDAVSCHYTEALRMQCNKYSKESPAEYYQKNKRSIHRRFAGNTLKMNDIMYPLVCNHFNPLYTAWILSSLKGGRVLDPFMGWGDRLIGALSSGVVSEYHGYDTNESLQQKYTEITYDFQESQTKTDFKCIPFEDADLPEEYYDIVLTSPPYGPDLEQYQGQPVIGVTSLEERYTAFMEIYSVWLSKISAALRPGGHLVFYVEDFAIKGISFPLRQQTRELLEKLSFTAAEDFYLMTVTSGRATRRCSIHYIKNELKPLS